MTNYYVATMASPETKKIEQAYIFTNKEEAIKAARTLDASSRPFGMEKSLQKIGLWEFSGRSYLLVWTDMNILHFKNMGREVSFR